MPLPALPGGSCGKFSTETPPPLIDLGFGESWGDRPQGNLLWEVIFLDAFFNLKVVGLYKMYIHLKKSYIHIWIRFNDLGILIKFDGKKKK